MSIKILYLIKEKSALIERNISFEEYFELEDDELVEINSIPKYSQPYMYTGHSIDNILLVSIFIEFNDEKRLLTQTIWNNGNNFLTRRTDFGRDKYEEIILSIKVDEAKGVYETIRLFVGETFTVPIYHSFIYSDDIRNEIEMKVDIDNFIELVKKGLIK